MARIELIITGDNTGAVNALRGLANVVINVNNTINNVNNGVNNFNNQINNFGNGLRGARSSSDGFMASLARLTIVGAGVIATLNAVKDAAERMFAPGYNFVKSMEQNELGMAGIIKSMTLMNGQAVPFANALGISSDMMKKLNQDALRTAATTEELVTTFRAILAPGIGAGMTLDQIRQITVSGANAIKSIMPGNSEMQRQMVQEIRDLVQGGIQAASSTLATSLGITDADITRAKNSSEGLFKFLMDRLKGFDEAAEKFPDTLTGKQDMLKEVWVQAGAAFVNEFEKPIKDGLTFLIGLIGEIDTKTGSLKINPGILSTIDDVKKGLQNIKDLVDDLSPVTDSVFDPATKSAKTLYGVLKDLGVIFLDLARIQENINAPIMKFFWEELNREIESIKWFTNEVRYLLDLLGKKLGIKKETDNKPQGMADFRQQEDTNTLPPVQTTTLDGDLTSKFPNRKQQVARAQEALKLAEAQIKADTEMAKAQIKADAARLESLHQQGTLISEADYATKKAALDYKLLQVDQESLQRILEVVNGTMYEDDKTQRERQGSLNEQIKVATAALERFGATLTDVETAASTVSGEGNTWSREVGGVNIEGLKDNAKSAIAMLGAWFQKETGKQMTVSSGLRDWGGHVSGTKFDVVDDAVSRDLEDNKNGIRDRMIAYAQSIGLQVLDEYADPSERATAGHLDFNAKDFTATFVAQAKAKFEPILTKSGLEYQKDILALFAQADEIAKQLAEARGDISSRQKAELAAKYDEQITKFTLNGMDNLAKMTQELKDSQFAKLDFSQAQKKLEIANEEMVTVQIDLLNNMAAGTKSAAQVSDEYTKHYNDKTQAILAELQRQLAAAGDDRELANKIRAAIRGISDKLSEFFDAVIQRIDAELQNEISMINADRSLTSMQKSDAIDAVTRQKAAERADEQEKHARELREKDRADGKNDNAAAIADLETAAELNRRLAETPTLLDKVHQSSKQAFEDGLLTFLTDGITQCNSLGEAFRNLANSVLQSIQKIYAEAVTKNIMSLLGLGATAGAPTFTLPTQTVSAFAEGGSMVDSGLVRGPGTATSDSMLAWVDNVKKFIRVGNGEWVIRGEAAKKYGHTFMDRLNRGLVPPGILKAYATGGSLTDRSVAGSSIPGPQDLAASLVNNNSTSIPLKIVNINDPNEVGRYLQSRNGEKVMVNFMKNNAGMVRQILNIQG